MDMAELAAWGDRRSAMASKILEEQPGIHPITAIVMAGDRVSAEEATARVEAGADPVREGSLIGSYARFMWCWEHLDLDTFFGRIAELWRGSDPDDTDPAMLQIWQEASTYFDHKLITDQQKDLPLPASNGRLTVYRGEEDPQVGGPTGIAFTLDPEVARKFATGAGSRMPKHGVVLHCSVEPGDVLAYITGRHEEEVIIDPTDVRVLGTLR